MNQKTQTEILSSPIDDEPVLHPFALGASLYVPGNRIDLAEILRREKLPGLRSVIVCLEDAIHEREVPRALYNLQLALRSLRNNGLLTFVRPRDPVMLKRLLRLDNIEALHGFVLPKLTEHNTSSFAEVLSGTPDFQIMPIIETDVAFDHTRLEALRARLQEIENPVLCLRIGGNDLLRLLGLHRPRGLTLYETPLRGVIDDLIKVFRPAGFELAAPVFGYLDDPELLAREVEMDVIRGLLTKGAICPAQITVIERAYRVSRRDYDSARALLAPGAPAVFKAHGQMLEVAVHRYWAERLLLRAEYLGLAAD